MERIPLIKETSLFPFTDVIFTTSCHHLRAPEYYIATVQNQCSWKAYPCSSYLWFWSGLCNRCYGECPSMGYSADKTKHTGSYFLDTTSKKPFCGEHSVEAFAIFKGSLCNKFGPCSIAISVFLTFRIATIRYNSLLLQTGLEFLSKSTSQYCPVPVTLSRITKQAAITFFLNHLYSAKSTLFFYFKHRL